MGIRLYEGADCVAIHSPDAVCRLERGRNVKAEVTDIDLLRSTRHRCQGEVKYIEHTVG